MRRVLTSVFPLVVATATATALTLAPRLAHADEPPSLTPATAAQLHYTAGRDSYRVGLYGRAREDFERSLALTPSPNTRLYLARTLRELGRWSESAEQYALTMREAEQRGGRYLATRDAAIVELEDVKARLARSAATATATTATPPAPSAPASSAPASSAPASSAPAPAPAPAPPAAPPPTLGPPRSPRSPSSLTWVTGGVTLAGTAAFAVLYALASDRHGYLEDRCTRVRSPACDDALTTGRAEETAAYVSLGVAAVTAAIVVYSLVAPAGPASPPASATAHLPEARSPWRVSF